MGGIIGETGIDYGRYGVRQPLCGAVLCKKRYQVFVLNRNNRPQPEGVTLIEADRHSLGDELRDYHFDVIFDITAYTARDVEQLKEGLGESFVWYLRNRDAVNKKPLIEYIDANLL